MIKAETIYPITVITYPDGSTASGISFIHLEAYTAPIKYNDLMQQLQGQTSAEAGAYISDVERWLNKLPVVD